MSRQLETDRFKLEDVAAEAGVSLSTASRALRNHPSVRQSTRRRVQAVAARLGYEPNRMASALRTRTSPFVGIVVPDITIPFYGLAVKAAQEVLERAGYQVLLMNTDRRVEQEREALRTLLSHRARGLLLATSGGFEDSAQMPVVFFSNFEPSARSPRVALSNREGIRLLVEHLVGHGHQRILYIGGRTTVTSGSERAAAFEEAMRDAGLEKSMQVWLSDDSWSAESAEQAIRESFAGVEKPTAVLTAGDMFALGALKALRALGKRVPEDIALVTFQDPDRVGGTIDPPLTTIAPQERELGQHAAALLLHTLDVSGDSSATEVRLPATLVVRRSCGCAAD
ncbi:MAG: LacI family DNA-binding transcriptional regulator [Gaiellaceae bacterium]